MEKNKLEILKMARENALNEFLNTREQLHEKWLKESELLWRQKQQPLPYPTIPPYPSEDIILERARKMMYFCWPEEPPPEEPAPPVPPPEPQPTFVFLDNVKKPSASRTTRSPALDAVMRKLHGPK